MNTEEIQVGQIVRLRLASGFALDAIVEQVSHPPQLKPKVKVRFRSGRSVSDSVEWVSPDQLEVPV